MAIPDYQAVMLPLLRLLGDGQERRLKDLYGEIARLFQLTEEEIAQKLPGGTNRTLVNRVGWAKTYLKAAGLLEQPARGMVRVTAAGREFLARNSQTLTSKMLEEYPAFREFFTKSSSLEEAATPPADPDDSNTPQELLENSFKTLQEATKAELLDRLKSSDPAFFEKAVVKLLVAMGYGGVEGEAKVTGKPGDGGIDGTISEDKLGLDVICIQAKRYNSASVGRQEVQGFAGSMDLERSKKGVFLTTSEFTRDAREYVNRIEGKKVILIDGKLLTELMLNYNVGVTPSRTYELKEVSNDFFDDELE